MRMEDEVMNTAEVVDPNAVGTLRLIYPVHDGLDQKGRRSQRLSLHLSFRMSRLVYR